MASSSPTAWLRMVSGQMGMRVSRAPKVLTVLFRKEEIMMAVKQAEEMMRNCCAEDERYVFKGMKR